LGTKKWLIILPTIMAVVLNLARGGRREEDEEERKTSSSSRILFNDNVNC
jgi:hypothetical protein